MRKEGPKFELRDEYYFVFMMKLAFVILFEVSSQLGPFSSYSRAHHSFLYSATVSSYLQRKDAASSIYHYVQGSVLYLSLCTGECPLFITMYSGVSSIYHYVQGSVLYLSLCTRECPLFITMYRGVSSIYHYVQECPLFITMYRSVLYLSLCTGVSSICHYV